MPATSVGILLDEVKCYACLGASISQLIKLALMRRVLLAANPSADVSVAGLMEYAKCYACYGASTVQLLELALMDQVQQSDVSSCLLSTYPSYVTTELGVYADVTHPSPGMTEIIWRSASVGQFFQIISQPDLTTVRMPNLVTANGDVAFNSDPKLTLVEFPLLTTINSNFDMSTNASLNSISFPSLVNINKTFSIRTSPLLTSINMGNVVFANGATRQYHFNGCALPASFINHILARMVASGVTNITSNLSGGTNAAPSGQGVIDKAALIAAGCTISTN